MCDSKPGQIVTVADAHTYITAGRAVLTLVSGRTGCRFTYKVTAVKDRDTKKPTGSFFVSVLSGADSRYTYIGLLTSTGLLIHTAGSRVADTAPSFVAFRWAAAGGITRSLGKDLEIFHDGACGRCGRALTVPASVASGLGPVCSKRVMAA